MCTNDPAGYAIRCQDGRKLSVIITEFQALRDFANATCSFDATLSHIVSFFFIAPLNQRLIRKYPICF